MFITYIFLAITVLVSLAAFNDAALLNKLILFPFGMSKPKEYYRLLTSGFIHADWNHLIFNMLTFYFFGEVVETKCAIITQSTVLGAVMFALFYLSAIVVSSIPAMIKHKNHSYYRALGASGGVSAVLFFVIYYLPWLPIRLMFIPIGFPAILFGLIYSLYSAYMSKNGNDNIGHDAHLGGAIYGFIFAFLVDSTHGMSLLEQLMHPEFHF